MSGGVGRRLHVVVWGPHSPCVVLGTRHHLWVVLLGACGFLWVVFLGTRRFSWVEVLGLCRCLWLVVLAPRSPFGGLGVHHFSWVEVPSFEGEGRGSSFVCVGAHCHSSALVFCAVCLSLSFTIRRCLSSVSIIAGCLSSIVSRRCCPVLFCVVTWLLTWWHAFPLGGGDVVGARHRVSWLGYDRGGIEGLTLAIKR